MSGKWRLHREKINRAESAVDASHGATQSDVLTKAAREQSLAALAFSGHRAALMVGKTGSVSSDFAATVGFVQKAAVPVLSGEGAWIGVATHYLKADHGRSGCASA